MKFLQGKIDRYMRNVESGLFSLRARMGAIKGSCLIDFGERSNFSVGKFVKAEQLLERQQQDGSLSSDDALSKCRNSYSGDTQIDPETFRLVNLEGSQERDFRGGIEESNLFLHASRNNCQCQQDDDFNSCKEK